MHEMRIRHATKGADSCIEKNILFGKYRIITTLAVGSTSTVYLAEHLKLKIFRVIKSIPKNTVSESSFSLEESFPTEAHLLKNLNHPGIPLIYDIDEDSDYVYMIEEYIQGESLDMFMSHQEDISQELIIKIGIQLCDILDYLHHLSPYPILYQDLKPEHIILCGNQIKLVDFGIASFFTGSGKNYQFYGTAGYTAPEALLGHSIDPSADIYSLGKVLSYLAGAGVTVCSPQLIRIIRKASAVSPNERFETAACLKAELSGIFHTACPHSSHLIRNIAVTGSKAGAGATHFAVSLVSTLNKAGQRSVYLAANHTDTISCMTWANPSFREKKGIFYYDYFQGVPSYGEGIENLIPDDAAVIKDYGLCPEDITKLEAEDLIFFIISGSDWDLPQALSLGNRLKALEHIVFICNYNNKKAAKKYARLLERKIYCFPEDKNPYRVTAQKERLVSAIFQKKGGKKRFLALADTGQVPIRP